MRKRSFVAALLSLVAGVTISACGSAAGGAAAVKSPAATGGGVPLLSLKDVGRLGSPTSPQAVVMQALFYWQWGSVPNFLGLYSPKAVQAVSAPVFSGEVNYGRPYVTSVRPQVSFVRASSANTSVVGVTLLSPNGAATRESFTVQRVHGSWQIAYDTMTDRLLVPYIASRSGVGFGADKSATAQAHAYALKVAELYRTATVAHPSTAAPTASSKATPAPKRSSGSTPAQATSTVTRSSVTTTSSH